MTTLPTSVRSSGRPVSSFWSSFAHSTTTTSATTASASSSETPTTIATTGDPSAAAASPITFGELEHSSNSSSNSIGGSKAKSVQLSFFDMLCVAAIVANFIAFAAVKSFDDDSFGAAFFLTVNKFCLCAFTVELVMKFVAYRSSLTNPHHEACLDFVVDVFTTSCLLLALLEVDRVFGAFAFLRVTKLRKIVGPRTGALRLLDALLQRNVARNIAGALFVLAYGIFVFAVLGCILFHGAEVPQLFEVNNSFSLRNSVSSSSSSNSSSSSLWSDLPIEQRRKHLLDSVGWSTPFRNFNSTPTAIKLVFDGSSPDTFIGFVTDYKVGFRRRRKTTANDTKQQQQQNQQPEFLGALPIGIVDQQEQQQQDDAEETVERFSRTLIDLFYVVSYALLGIVGPSFLGTVIWDALSTAASPGVPVEFAEFTAAWLRVTPALVMHPQEFLDRVVPMLSPRFTGLVTSGGADGNVKVPTATVLRFLLNVPIPLVSEGGGSSSSCSASLFVSHDLVLASLAGWSCKLSRPEMLESVFRGHGAFAVASAHVSSGDAFTLGHYFAAKVILQRWRRLRGAGAME